MNCQTNMCSYFIHRTTLEGECRYKLMLSNSVYYSRAPVVTLSQRYPYDNHIMQALSPAQWQEDFTALHFAERMLLRWTIAAAVNTLRNMYIAKPLDRLGVGKCDHSTTHRRRTEFLSALNFESQSLHDRQKLVLLLLLHHGLYLLPIQSPLFLYTYSFINFLEVFLNFFSVGCTLYIQPCFVFHSLYLFMQVLSYVI